MAGESGPFPPGGHLPQLDGLVPTARGQGLPIGTEGHTGNYVPMVTGNRALPDWLEGRGGSSQQLLYFLVFWMVRLQ